MNKIITIVKDIELHPKYLDTSIKSHIKNMLESQQLCCQTYGHVLKIIDISKLESLTISSITKFPVFRVTFTAESILPKEGQIVKGGVSMIFSQGLFIIKGPIKILLPLAGMKDFKFDRDTKSLINDTTSIKEGDEIEVKLTIIKYEKKSFNCISTMNI
jgi:DNA-directed RNA polymerase subunit E'/Rpb7